MECVLLILRALCFIGMSLVLKTLGCDVSDWQWWMIMMIVIVYTVLLALSR